MAANKTPRSGRGISLATIVVVSALALTACGGEKNADSTAGTKAGGKFVIGVSNTLAGNGWREEMICAVKAESVASGVVSKVIAVSKNGGPTDQIQDLQSLISQGVNAIVVNPADRDKLNPVIEEAIAQGIVVVAVDSPVSAKGAYVAVNDQKAWGKLTAEWLFKQMGGTGKVLYMRGIEGVPADSDRHAGVKEALATYSGITVKEVWTGWDYTKAGEIAVQELSSGSYQGVWTSGTDYTVVNAIQTAGIKPIPVTGQETNAFIGQLINGAPGAVTTNPAIIGGVGAHVAIEALQGKKPNLQTILTPKVLDATTGKADLQAAYDPKLDQLYSSTFSIDGLTTFTRSQLTSCKGPGE
ncbi:MAG: LacI family transcriptional regulator [Candidatus Lumbricidophila eiseniae]|uniref:LacI family transcriptional regulator n=1 Tax=Candidatus Lumbricidiphila eiseniae TaxID=1969409 RepID=A0A2A6FQT1_9MICO|nr:MAG: LacI family transcriptional regulator [Candidatus Lumbricidophila eiseniae]